MAKVGWLRELDEADAVAEFDEVDELEPQAAITAAAAIAVAASGRCEGVLNMP
ncbi:MAG: hypothetical protein ACRDPA_35055 [Solirubrobacteraceae bacterium]